MTNTLAYYGLVLITARVLCCKIRSLTAESYKGLQPNRLRSYLQIIDTVVSDGHLLWYQINYCRNYIYSIGPNAIKNMQSYSANYSVFCYPKNESSK
jgi:hypothetical protein